MPLTGKDATESFEDVGHSDEAREILKTLFIGTFGEPEVCLLYQILCILCALSNVPSARPPPPLCASTDETRTETQGRKAKGESTRAGNTKDAPRPQRAEVWSLALANPLPTNHVLFSRATRPSSQHPHFHPPISSLGRILRLAVLWLRTIRSEYDLVGRSLMDLEYMIVLFAFDTDTLRSLKGELGG